MIKKTVDHPKSLCEATRPEDLYLEKWLNSFRPLLRAVKAHASVCP